MYHVICENKACRTLKLTKQKTHPPRFRTAVYEEEEYTYIYVYTYAHTHENFTFECIIRHM